MYNPNEIKSFYNNYGENEWQMLELTPYDRINYYLHMDFHMI